MVKKGEKKKVVKLFVEGGGDAKEQHIDFRSGMRTFLEAAGLKGSMPRIVACGGRENAYDEFCTTLRQGKYYALLLVDSEEPVHATCQSGDPEQWNPWLHLKKLTKGNWEKPAASEDTDCHLMVQCMENWFLADRETLSQYFGDGFRDKALPPETTPIESLEKKRVYNALDEASRNTQKGNYLKEKGKHSFALLAKINPQQVMEASPWAHRFVTAVRKKMGSAHAD